MSNIIGAAQLRHTPWHLLHPASGDRITSRPRANEFALTQTVLSEAHQRYLVAADYLSRSRSLAEALIVALRKEANGVRSTFQRVRTKSGSGVERRRLATTTLRPTDPSHRNGRIDAPMVVGRDARRKGLA